jgi:hypothetical protein
MNEAMNGIGIREVGHLSRWFVPQGCKAEYPSSWPGPLSVDIRHAKPSQIIAPALNFKSPRPAAVNNNNQQE